MGNSIKKSNKVLPTNIPQITTPKISITFKNKIDNKFYPNVVSLIYNEFIGECYNRIEIIRDNKIKQYIIPKQYIIKIYKTTNKKNNQRNNFENEDGYDYYIQAYPISNSIMLSYNYDYICFDITQKEANVLTKYFGNIEIFIP
jgi:hypothetical protein